MDGITFNLLVREPYFNLFSLVALYNTEYKKVCNYPVINGISLYFICN